MIVIAIINVVIIRIVIVCIVKLILSMVMVVTVIIKMKDNSSHGDNKLGNVYIHLTSAIQQ